MTTTQTHTTATATKVYNGAAIRQAMQDLGTRNVREAVRYLDHLADEAEVFHCPICDGAGHGAERHEA
jgi:hypothetical protein